MVKLVWMPAGTEAGFTEVMLGTTVGWVITKARGAERPPPGAGLLTVTWTVPGVAMSAVEIVAEAACGAAQLKVLETAVGLATPLKFSTALDLKFEPWARMVKGREPATTVVG
jgi:hypothetical protein